MAAAGGAVAAAAAAGAGLRRLHSRDGRDPFEGETSYRLFDGEPVGPGIRRIITAQVDDALAQLRGETGSSHAEAVHEARKDLKKVRSALRLVRSELGDESFARENRHYRDTGRMLSEARDAEVRVESLDELVERFDPALEGRFARLREAFEAELSEARDGGSLERAMAQAADALEDGRPRLGQALRSPRRAGTLSPPASTAPTAAAASASTPRSRIHRPRTSTSGASA